ncbi:four helix bundle protein [Candidatus Saccharibacteria bacterium]|nr:MAG: four helix bundle protein [Candidatus Saccharibacteria bacterium]
MKTYKDLIVWQKSRSLVKDTYLLCSKLPKDEVYGLCSQMKRASVSIPSNIAEGYRRNNQKEYIQFLGIAAGSAAELETQLILADDLFGVATSDALEKLEEIQKMLTVLIRKLDPKP